MSDEERYQEELYQRQEYEREEAQKAAMEQYAHDDYRLSLVAKIDDSRLRELAEAEREGRVVIHEYDNCHRCPQIIGRTIKDEPCKSCYARYKARRALADAWNATEPKGEAEK